MNIVYDVMPTREQLKLADEKGKAWVSDSYLMCNGIQGLSNEYDRKSYAWYNEVIKLKGLMTSEGYSFKVDRLY